MSLRKILKDNTHVTISGVTGSGEEFGGKSATANWWVSESVEKGHKDLGIFFNPKRDKLQTPEGNEDYRTVRSLQGIAESYRHGYRKFDFQPRSTDGTQEHANLMEWIRQMPDSAIVAHDEAADYAGEDSLHWATARGGNEADLRNLVIAQRPWDLSDRTLNNTPVKTWVGPTTPEAKRYFQSMQIESAWEKVERATGQYKWNVIDGGEYLTTVEPVDSTYAP